MGILAGVAPCWHQPKADKSTAQTKRREVLDMNKNGKFKLTEKEGWPKPPFRFYLTLALEVELRGERQHALASRKSRLASCGTVCVGRRNGVNGYIAIVSIRTIYATANVVTSCMLYRFVHARRRSSYDL